MRTGRRGRVCDASAGAAVVSVGADGRAGAGDPGRARARPTGGRCSCSSSPVGTARRSGRCSSVTASVASDGRSGPPDHAAMSGPRRARCCTSTRCELPKFEVPGHWAHGDRTERQQHPQGRQGQADRRRRRPHASGLLRDPQRRERDHRLGDVAPRRGLVCRAGLRPGPGRDERQRQVLRRSHEFRDTLAELDARHILIPPRTPRWNGKVERFFRTLDTDWAHGRVWPKLPPTRPRPVIVHPLLQPQATAHRRRRPSPITRVH